MTKFSDLWITSVIAFTLQLSVSQSTPLVQNVDNSKPIPHMNCGKHERLYEINGSTTEFICDCLPYSVYVASSDSCHPPFTQGPCPEHHYISVDYEHEPACVKSPCTKKNEIPYHGYCQELEVEGEACPKDQILRYDFDLSQLACVPNISAFIVDTGCRRHSRRDKNGKCRKMV